MTESEGEECEAYIVLHCPPDNPLGAAKSEEERDLIVHQTNRETETSIKRQRQRKRMPLEVGEAQSFNDR